MEADDPHFGVSVIWICKVPWSSDYISCRCCHCCHGTAVKGWASSGWGSHYISLLSLVKCSMCFGFSWSYERWFFDRSCAYGTFLANCLTMYWWCATSMREECMFLTDDLIVNASLVSSQINNVLAYASEKRSDLLFMNRTTQLQITIEPSNRWFYRHLVAIPGLYFLSLQWETKLHWLITYNWECRKR